MASKKRSKSTKPPAGFSAVLRLAKQNALLAKSLARAKDQHIRDLRILQSNQQEQSERNEGLMRLVLEHHFYRPTISKAGSIGKPERMQPSIPLEVMGEAEADDRELIEKQNSEFTEASEALRKLTAEHQASRAGGLRGQRVSAEEMEAEEPQAEVVTA